MRVLLTGAVAGLGRALCNRLLDEGHHVVAVDHDNDGLLEMKKSSDQNPDIILTDLGDVDAVSRLIENLGQYPKFDLIILNAGISATGKFEEIPVNAYQKMLTLNTQTPMVMASAMLGRAMVEKGGTIVFVSSLSHATGYPGASVYGASKDAITIYAKSIRRSCAVKNINILTVFPGPIKTRHAERHAPSNANGEKRMAPDKLAHLILKAVKARKRHLYPGPVAKLIRVTGWLFPASITKLMRRIIFEKLDDPTY